MLAWSRRERLRAQSAIVRSFAARLDQIFTSQVVKASSIPFAGVNDIYVTLWELEQLIELVEDTLMAKTDGAAFFVQQLLQDSISMDSFLSSPLISAKYGLFKDWMTLQRNMLVAWICYARLPTHAADFWIQRRDAAAEIDAQTVDTSIENINASKEGGENVDESGNEMWNEFAVAKERLPALLISHTLALKIKFIGEAIKILDLAKKRTKTQETWLQATISSIFVLSQSKSSEAQGFKTFFGHWNALEAAVKINEMEQWAAASLHSLFMVEKKLLSHFLVLRDFFFLQDGFFYRTLFELSDNLMSVSPGINAEHDLNIFFQESAATKQFLGEDSKSRLFQKLKLTFNPSYQCLNKEAKDEVRVWSKICLDYAVTWPINLILSPITLSQYNEIFQLLFQVKRLQVGLQHSWMSMRPKNLPHRLTHRFQQLRMQMGSFIDMFSQYLHIDVFTSQMQALDERLEKICDFEDLLASHSLFLSQLRLQCFLSVLAFKRTFALLFDTITQLNTLVREFVGTFTKNTASDSDALASKSKSYATSSSSSFQNSTEESITTELEAIMKDWAKNTALLFTLLSGVKGQAPHLHYLLLLLDFNMFFSDPRSIPQQESENPLEAALDDNARPVRAPRMSHVRTRSNITTMIANTSDSDLRVRASSSSSSKPGLKQSPSAPALDPEKRQRSSSVGPPKVGAERSTGPRPELLARLMKKSNK